MRIVKLVSRKLSLALLIASLSFSLLPSVLSGLSFAASTDRISGALTGGQTIALRGNVRHQALPQYDLGPVDPAMKLGNMMLLIVPTAAQQKAVTQLLAQQQNRKSPNYHKWITAEQYADRFGLSQDDMQKITAWLQAEGFTIIQSAHGRNWVSFAGTAAQVESAFGTEIHQYNVGGELHYANATAPMIPVALSGIVAGVRGLDDFRPRPMGVRKVHSNYYASSQQFDYLAPGDIYTIYDINPLLNAATPINGTGQKLAVMGQTPIYLSDINDFRSGFGLPTITCTTSGAAPNDIVTACSDPHFSYVAVNGGPPALTLDNLGELGESDLDIEWSSAIAPGAEVIFVDSPDTFTSFYYAIDNQTTLGETVISLSYGACEFDANIGELLTGQTVLFETELQKANTEGITFVNSSGDTGAAECDANGTPPNGSLTSTGLATLGLAVSYPASSPEVTGVGGTALPLGDIIPPSATYWASPTTNPTNGGSALSYIPDQAWNDDDEFFAYCQLTDANKTFCTQGGTTAQPGWVSITSEATAQDDIGIGSSGGGVSNCAVQNADFSACVSGFAQPAYQTVTVAGQAGGRFSPDISFLATPNFPGYIFCTQNFEENSTVSTGSSCAPGGSAGIAGAVNNFSIIGGTSVSAPLFAGIVTLLNQYTGSTGLGNINVDLYQLAATAPAAFHDVTSGDNNVACEVGTPTTQPTTMQCPSTGVIGYPAGAGFDLATGLGSMDVNNFAVALKSPPDFTASSSTSTLSIFNGQSATATITVTPINNFSAAVSFACSGLATTATCSFNPATVTPTGGAPATTTATITSTGTAAANPTIAITASTGVLSQASHSAASIVVNMTPAFTLAPTAASFQVTQGASVNATVAVTVAAGFTGTIAFTCSDPASESICTVPQPINASGQVSFAISTTAPTTSLNRPVHPLNPSGRSSRIFYAMLLPGLLGIVLAGGTRRRSFLRSSSLRGMRFLGLIVVLGFSTVWLGSCGGGSSSGSSNPGTPKNSYTISVNATSGSATTTAATFQLVVQ
jgi:subtilase family serine protease